MPSIFEREFMDMIFSGLLELVDLRYNLAEGFEIFKNIKKPEVLLSEVGTVYDDDP